MKIIGLIMVFGVIVLLEVPKLIQDKMWGELMAFSGLLLFGMVISFAAVLQFHLPNPTQMVEVVFGPPAKILNTLFK